MDDLQPMESAQNVDDAQPVETPPSILRRVFRNRFHHWRAGWRILVYCILLFLGIIGLSALIAWLVPEPDGGMMSWGLFAVHGSIRPHVDRRGVVGALAV